jgi:hypothetical protein
MKTNKKLTPKRQAQLSHKIIVLCDLMIDTLDELEVTSKMGVEMKVLAERMLDNCVKLTNDAFAIQSIRSSTYIQELSNKVDTVIRRSYEHIF